ncbi:hypothetical protein F6R98_07995 [Candidatus Methylospira mobilis]|uniref:Uncharacterized protein n=1 Tax=Candidatus Methylospira mobilis TaxID=1808979 RepID=A0A5Q0BLC5_9GAMM|nr:hypothetical protein [Candidatus Methylospira mobilis]QFY42566.1 hypothetical protein F6R98_07995 [Candidatus Methylospira mobilis]WNV04319.1 hypothetical protein RP726_18220 [Candidatus Methylospira mobilis]
MMNSSKPDAAQPELIREVSLRISISKLLRLLCDGTLHAEDFSCLDWSSREIIRRSLLSVSTGAMQ